MRVRSLSVVQCAGVAALVAFAVVVFLQFYKFQGEVTGFFRIGSEMPLSPYLNPQKAFIHMGKVGNDGQQFLTLALDPLLSNPESIKALDLPAYRYRRILYPSLGSILGFGSPLLVPFALVFVNILSLAGMVFVVGLLLKRHAQPVWQSLLVLCVPGVWMTLSIATADLLNGVLLLSALLFYDQKKPALTALALCLACLTREASLLFLGAFALDALLNALLHINVAQCRKPLYWLSAALFPVVAWNLYALNFLSRSVENSLQSVSGSANIHFTAPFFGLASKLFELARGGKGAQGLYDAGSFSLILFVGLLLTLKLKKLWVRARAVALCAAFSVLLLTLTSMQILGHFVDYSRVHLALPLLLIATFAWDRAPFSHPQIPHQVDHEHGQQEGLERREAIWVLLQRGLFAGAGLASLAYLVVFALEFRS